MSTVHFPLMTTQELTKDQPREHKPLIAPPRKQRQAELFEVAASHRSRFQDRHCYIKIHPISVELVVHHRGRDMRIRTSRSRTGERAPC